MRHLVSLLSADRELASRYRAPYNDGQPLRMADVEWPSLQNSQPLCGWRIFIRCSWDPTHDLITLWYPMLMGLLHSRIFMSKPLKVINIQLQYFKLTIHKVNRLQNEHWKLGHSHGSMCTIYSRQRKSWWTLALSCWPADVAFNSPKVNIFSLCST